ncbi:MAG: MoaD/ThiS family protein [Acidobacteriaceae bacterium]
MKDVLQKQEEVLPLAEGATVDTLIDFCRQRSPEKTQLWQSLAIAVNQQYADASHVLRDGDEVAMLPPVSGGLTGVAR